MVGGCCRMFVACFPWFFFGFWPNWKKWREPVQVEFCWIVFSRGGENVQFPYLPSFKETEQSVQRCPKLSHKTNLKNKMPTSRFWFFARLKSIGVSKRSIVWCLSRELTFENTYPRVLPRVGIRFAIKWNPFWTTQFRIRLVIPSVYVFVESGWRNLFFLFFGYAHFGIISRQRMRKIALWLARNKLIDDICMYSVDNYWDYRVHIFQSTGDYQLVYKSDKNIVTLVPNVGLISFLCNIFYYTSAVCGRP